MRSAITLPATALLAGPAAALGLAAWSGPGFTGAVNQGALVLRFLGLLAFAAASLLLTYPAFAVAVRGPARWYERVGVVLWALGAWAGGVALAFVVLAEQP